ncbi:MAG: flagellar motor switch protein FliG [Gammaproteobacteria bacterium]|nr:flagellar motor switch protein FliG [Gammaproteobacteria bacterium]
MANNAPPKVTGSDRAAILMLALGEDVAAQILKHMDPKEVQKIGVAMTELKNVTKDQVDAVILEFGATVEKHTNIGLGTDEYIRKMLTSALGEDKARTIIDRIILGGNSKGLETLKWMDPRAVAELVRLEHPQIISIILAYLEAEQAAEVLSILPERVRIDVTMRIASLDGIPPAALQELNTIMEKQFTGQNNVKSSSVGGLKSAANILNFVDTSVESDIMDNIKEVDAELGQKIQDLMFVFDNLGNVDDRSIQTLLREVSSESLIIALKGADDTLKEKFFGNMSKRAGEMLREDLEAKGPVRLSEVQAAQKEILAIARRMAEAGDLTLASKGGDDFV